MSTRPRSSSNPPPSVVNDDNDSLVGSTNSTSHSTQKDDTGLLKAALTSVRIQQNLRLPSTTSKPKGQDIVSRHISVNVSLPGNLTKEDFDKDGHPRIPRRGHYTRESCDQRLEWLEKFTGTSLRELGNWWENERTDPLKSSEILKSNIENPVGVIKVPVAAAGPLLFHGEHANGYIVCPIATTEGALVASLTRGATALNQAGGVKVKCIHQRMVRAPFWDLASPLHLKRLKDLITSTLGLTTIRAEVSKHSTHAHLVDIEFKIVDETTLHVRFLYETGDAAGQNMTTTCTWEVCRLINATIESLNKEHKVSHPQELYIDVRHFMIEGNVSGDKKLSSLNMESGRGTKAVAESIIPSKVLIDTMKVDDPKVFVQGMNHFRNATKSVVGTHGTSINCVNVIAGVYAACGQDMASVTESSAGDFEVEWVEPCEAYPQGGARCKMTLHNLVIGTVGGGTGLPTQKECLSMMGCYGRGKVKRMAEIITGYALALDMSTLAALVSHQFAKAHERLGRNKPHLGFTVGDMTPVFFQEILDKSLVADGAKFKSWSYNQMDSSESILGDISAGSIKNKLAGLYACTIHYTTPAHPQPAALNVVLKVKTTDVEVNNALNKMAFNIGGSVKDSYDHLKTKTGFTGCHIRELLIASTVLKDSPFLPRLYNVKREDAKDFYVLIMEQLVDGPGGNVTFLKTANEGSLVWKEEHIKVALRDVAQIHSKFLHSTSSNASLKLLEPVRKYLEVLTPQRAEELTPLHQALLQHSVKETPDLFNASTIHLLTSCIQNLKTIVTQLQNTPQTLIHNDFSPRNICFRLNNPSSSSSSASNLSLCIYDWELSTLGVPQRDVAELLCFTLDSDTPLSDWRAHILYHRSQLLTNENTEMVQGEEEYMKTFDLALCEFLSVRVMMYGMAHTFKAYGFYERVVRVGTSYLGRRVKESKALREALKLEGGDVVLAKL
ncbi:hypothetical protein HDV05_002292 [Chytridiales sp. JEL 0842]|nr:hypothetical protein HDV05_002292 [Chytridiales sp. JEL 0842]